MRHPLRLAVVLAVALLTTSACTSSGDGPPAGAASTSPAPPSPGASDTASPTSSSVGAALPDDLRTRPAVAAAIADMATRTKVDPAEVVIASWSPVTWNDGSLGCPQEGMSYTQSLVEGELLLLRTGTTLSQYNAPSAGPFVYCATPSASYTVGG